MNKARVEFHGLYHTTTDGGVRDVNERQTRWRLRTDLPPWAAMSEQRRRRFPSPRCYYHDHLRVNIVKEELLRPTQIDEAFSGQTAIP